MKKVVVLNGSPTEGGNTAVLSGKLAEGVRAAGNEAEVIDVAKLDIAPYRGFGQSVDDDDMGKVYEAILGADAVVVASPLYWMQFTAQMKAVLDRLPMDAHDRMAGKEVALLVCAASPEEKLEQVILPYFQMCFVESLGWQDAGHVLAGGVFAPGQVAGTPYCEQAAQLGRSL